MSFELEKQLELATGGDSTAIEKLLIYLKPLVTKISRKYFLVGGTSDDVVQEGMIGLYKAIITYKKDSSASFKTYATLCIKRQILSAIRQANNNKNLPLNAYFSINSQGMIVVSVSGSDDGEEEEKGIYISADTQTPEEAVVSKENVAEISNRIDKSLSAFEKQVLSLYIEGLNYVEIATKLNKEPKSIDNALSRIKLKLK